MIARCRGRHPRKNAFGQQSVELRPPSFSDCCPDERSTRVAVTDAGRTFRFPGLAPGKYSVEATLAGFSTVKYGNVTVSVGASATIEIRMTIAVEVSRRDRRM